MLATLCAPASTPKQVLILHSFGREVAPYAAVADSFRASLLTEFGATVRLHEMSLVTALTHDPEIDDHILDYLARRFSEKAPDLVVPIGAPAVKFVAQYQKRLFPAAPIVITGVDPRMVPPEFLKSSATLVSQTLNLPGMVEDVLRIRPGTTNITVVFGVSPLERFWAGECRREFQSFTNRVNFTWLETGNFDQVLNYCAAMPPHSVILFGMYILDELGIPCDGDLALTRLHAVANAPLFGYFASVLGKGTVGGRLYRDSEVGQRAAQVAARVLRGERPERIPPQILEAAAPVYDARELHRWGIREKDLPIKRVILFREPTFWELYRWRICIVVVIMLLQTVLIMGLLISRQGRKRTEMNLRASEEALRFSAARIASAVEVSGIGFYEVNEGFRVIFLDDRVRKLFGVEPGEDEPMWEKWLARIHPEDLPHVSEVKREIFDRHLEHATLEYRYLHPSGAVLWFHHLFCVLKRDTDGRELHVMGVIQDITARKQMETASEQLREEIAHLTRVATMGELTAALAHELNQPITAILNNAHAARRMIASGAPDIEEIREILMDIIADDQRAGEVVRRVRSLVKKERPQLQPLDVNGIIAEVIRLVRVDALIKGVGIRTVFSPDLPRVFSDRIQLQQVLLNIIINAFDAMKAIGGERVVTIQTKHIPGDGVIVSVRDSGPGIPPDKLEMIFTPFFSSKSGGLGMGLAISRTLITALGGRIWAENNVDGGATIQFNLPLGGSENHA